jgi:sec-independent protein translocase protein TatC
MATLTERSELITPPSSSDTADDGEKIMTLIEHLAELRRRLFISLFAVALGAVVGFVLAPDVIRILKAPINGPLYFTGPGAALFLQLKIAVFVGLVLASPVVFYELWAFISPGLTSQERRAFRPWIPMAVLFTALGVGVAYAILPVAAQFLLSFQIPGVIEPLITADAYFGLVTTMFVTFGLVMQFPFVIMLLARVGIIDAQRLRHARRYVLLAMFVFAVVIVPSGDPFSPTAMTVVAYPLYEFTIWMVARYERSKAAA